MSNIGCDMTSQVEYCRIWLYYYDETTLDIKKHIGTEYNATQLYYKSSVDKHLPETPECVCGFIYPCISFG